MSALIPSGHTAVMASRREAPELVSSEEARSRGLGWYFTGEACARGHIAKRSLSNRDCRGCVNERAARYRAEDPERIRRRDREAGALRPQRRDQARASWARHREKRLAEDRARHAAAPERKREYANRYWRENRERTYAKVNQRKARILKATPPWLTDDQREVIRALYLEAQRRPGEWHVDHIEPLVGKTSCGLHVPWNLQLLVGDENRRKGNVLALT